jgi:hypothetical protein
MQELRGRSKNIIGIIGVVVGFAVVGGVVASTLTKQEEVSEGFESTVLERDEGRTDPSVSYGKEEPEVQLRKLTHDDLLSADWSGSVEVRKNGVWITAGSYEVKREGSNNVSDFSKGRINDVISVRKTNGETVAKFESDVFLPDKQAPFIYNGIDSEYTAPPDRIVANGSLGRFYTLFIFGDSHDGLWKLYESDMAGHHLRELDGGRYPTFLPSNFRFSDDHTTLSYTFEPRRKAVIRIIDLLDPKKSVRFFIPGDLGRYIEEKKLEGAEENLAANWVASWQFTDNNALEFTRYYARGSENIGYTQMSERELWRYDMKTGEFTLLKTVPLEQ